MDENGLQCKIVNKVVQDVLSGTGKKGQNDSWVNIEIVRQLLNKIKLIPLLRIQCQHNLILSKN